MKTVLFRSQQPKKKKEEKRRLLIGKKPEDGSCLHKTGCTCWWCGTFRFWELGYPLLMTARALSRHVRQSTARPSARSRSVRSDGVQLQNAEGLGGERLLAKQHKG